jgi:hypothetical protein
MLVHFPYFFSALGATVGPLAVFLPRTADPRRTPRRGGAGVGGAWAKRRGRVTHSRSGGNVASRLVGNRTRPGVVDAPLVASVAMFTPAFVSRDGETCATPASARGALAATLRPPSSFVFATPVTARHDAPAFTPQPRAFRRDNDAIKPSNAPMALDVAPETASASGAHARAPASACADPHAQWHTPAPCVSRPGGAAPTSDGKIVFGRIPRHDGRAPNPKRDKSGASGTEKTSAHPLAEILRSPSALPPPPRTVRVAAETALATVEEEPVLGSSGDDGGAGPTVARQLFDEAERKSSNKAARSSLAMRSPRKPPNRGGFPFPSTDAEPRVSGGRKQPRSSQSLKTRDEDVKTRVARQEKGTATTNGHDSSRRYGGTCSFAEPQSTLRAVATAIPSAPTFGAKSFEGQSKPVSRTASRVGRLLMERDLMLREGTGPDHEIASDVYESVYDCVYASPFATQNELRGYGCEDDIIPFGDEERFGCSARGLGGVEGFVEAFESGNEHMFGETARETFAGGFEFGGEHKGGLPASRLEDRFASLGLGLAAER